MTESRAGITRSIADQTEITQDIPPAGPPPPAPGPPGFDVKAIVGPGKRPRGIVVSQVPGGGTRLATGQAVTLHVSNGQPVTTTTATTAPTTTASTTQTAPGATARVPDVVGQDDVSGAGRIEAQGFVAETDPVTVVGQKAASARAALLAAKLTVRTDFKQAPAKSVGVVLSQSPAAGGSAPAYTQVTIVVGST